MRDLGPARLGAGGGSGRRSLRTGLGMDRMSLVYAACGLFWGLGFVTRALIGDMLESRARRWRRRRRVDRLMGR